MFPSRRSAGNRPARAPDYDRQRRYERRKSAQAADIGPIPPVGNPERRKKYRLDLFGFLTTYFPKSTGLSPFSEDHRRVIERIQRCVLDGGLFINAVYRGFAKTTISENAAIWAVLHGHRRFVPLFGSGAAAAGGNIDSIKLELAENDLLYEDFPEVCRPIRALEGKPQRCASQTHEGRLTHIEWTSETIVLPQIAGSLASGAIITAHGISAASRGLKHKRPDGTQQRPDFVIIDDPQTDESASTAHQVTKRLDVIRKSILKLGGHTRKIAVVMNATVIRPDDIVERLLDPKRFPSWQGERIKMVKRWAEAHESMWLGDYARLRSTYDQDGIGDQQRAHKDATQFYRRNRGQMDRGCIVSWEHCFDPETELSAVQHAYNSLIDDGPDVFASECQNEPLVAKEEQNLLVKSFDITKKINGLARGTVPLGCEHVTAFIDVQGTLLYWLVAAFGQNFTGAVIDYGSFPDQRVPYFTLKEAKITLADVVKATGLEGQIRGGLDQLTAEILGRKWTREDGAEMAVGRCLIDANWGNSTDTVYQFCRESPHRAILLPSHGRAVKASDKPWNQYKQQEGERVGHHWMLPAIKGTRAIRHVVTDVNYWKSFIHARLAVAIGDKGCLSLFGNRPEAHAMLADHWTAEYPVRTEGRGRELDEWKLRPSRPDNHQLDNIVGCYAAASMLGCSLHSAPPTKPTKRRQRVHYI